MEQKHMMYKVCMHFICTCIRTLYTVQAVCSHNMLSIYSVYISRYIVGKIALV